MIPRQNPLIPTRQAGWEQRTEALAFRFRIVLNTKVIGEAYLGGGATFEPHRETN